MEIKHAVMADLDAATPGHAVLASNTSGLSITEIADATQRPHKVVGFHFFWPASVMRLIEVVEGEETLAETVQAAMTFAQQIRKVPIRAAECPGFVVNRILLSTASEAWRYQDESGVAVEQLDELHQGARRRCPMGPFRVADMSGLDTVVKVAQDMQAARTATASTSTAGCRSASSAASWAPRAGRASMSTADTSRSSTSGSPSASPSRRSWRRASCVEEGIAGVREIDLGMMLGTGMVPGPFARADFRGLDEVLAALERAEEEWGEHFAPPLLLRRLVAQGRLGPKTGQGFYPYPQPEPGYEEGAVKLDRRGEDIAVLWLDNPPANSLSPDVIDGARACVGGGRRAAARRGRRVPEPRAVLRRRRHQGLHAHGRRRRPGACSSACTRSGARWSARAPSPSRP